jgi:ryanodine receptor 2
VTYAPKPVDTSQIYLDKDLEDLVDYLAKNTHENWAVVRISQGWRFGQERNDAHKEHPCLVPYELLPESEKEHDRTVVRELLKTLLSLGFEIRKRKNGIIFDS